MTVDETEKILKNLNIFRPKKKDTLFPETFKKRENLEFEGNLEVFMGFIKNRTILAILE